ncbi:MAG: hypothetical protein P1U68_00040 [Verrucomicrobiales bacterium]|nr:hypothetical protein [Verrucomicrobiales bacterium]
MSEGETSTDPGLKSSPYPGCAILFTIVLVFGGLIILYTTIGRYQQKEIATFTQEEPAVIKVLEPTPEESAAAKAKLMKIDEAVSGGKAERLIFTAKDLNLLIASIDELEDFRGQTFIERISPQGIVAKMAQPMRKGFIKKDIHYLNATFVLKPELRARTLAFKVVDIRPVVGDVPKQFIDSYAVLDFFRLDPELDAIARNIGSVAAVYTEGDTLVVETKVPTAADEES